MMSQNTTHDRAALNAAFAAHVARGLGPTVAYHAAAHCPQGHRRTYAALVGFLCLTCLEAQKAERRQCVAERGMLAHDIRDDIRHHLSDLSWHPEWRFGPGEAMDFCGSMDSVIPVLDALGCAWSVALTYQGGRAVPMVLVVHFAGGQAEATVADRGKPSAWATALVQAALRVLEEATTR
jgi:hypothetical protein